jgi:glycine cleavage system H protein
LAGDVLVFTPKRSGKPFEAQRSFAIIECGKWVGAARAGFNGVVVAANAELERRPRLLNDDAFGKGWMLIVRADGADLKRSLLTGPGIGAAFAAWLVAESYKDRTE